jgi:hypothetical protein
MSRYLVSRLLQAALLLIGVSIVGLRHVHRAH